MKDMENMKKGMNGSSPSVRRRRALFSPFMSFMVKPVFCRGLD